MNQKTKAMPNAQTKKQLAHKAVVGHRHAFGEQENHSGQQKTIAFGHEYSAEQQAQNWANYWTNGLMSFEHNESGIINTQGLIRSEAAQFALPSASGFGLPSQLKEQFESIFHADFSQVRIHVGPTAHASAQQHHALAYAAGNHIVFQNGLYQPNSKEGKALLAHELTHVLQQTARRGSENKWIVHNTIGYGDVQCHDEIGSETPGITGMFDGLIQVYREAYGNHSTLNQTIERVRALTGGALLRDRSRPRFAWPLVEARAEFSRRTVDKVSKGFVFDCYKMLGFYHSAKDIIDSDHRLEVETLIPDGNFIRFLQNQPNFIVWSAEAMRHASLQRFWPSTVVAGYRDFLTTPHAPPPQVNARILETTTEKERERQEQVSNHEKLPQERVFMAWGALIAVERQRVRDCEQIRNELIEGSRRLTPTERLIHGIEHIKEREQNIVRNDSEPAFRRLLAERLVQMLDRDISPLWAQVNDDLHALRQSFEAFNTRELMDESISSTRSPNSDTVHHIPRFPANALNQPTIRQLHQIMSSHLSRLFPEETGSASNIDDIHGADSGNALLAPAAYAQSLDNFRTALNGIPGAESGSATGSSSRSASLLVQLDETFLRMSRNRSTQIETRRAFGVLIFLIDLLIQQTSNFNVAEADRSAFRDMQGGHRLRLARSCLWLLRWMGWHDLMIDVMNVMPTISADNTPQLWLLSDWVLDSETGLQKFREDFPEDANKPVLPGLPFTITHLAQWFQLDRNRRLQAVLMTQLAHEASARATTRLDFSGFDALDNTPEALRRLHMSAEANAQEAARGIEPHRYELTMPQRFKVEQFDAVVPYGREDDWASMIYAHPKTQVSVLRRMSHAPHSYAIAPKHERPSVFLWLLPSIQGLVDLVLSITRIQRLVPETSNGTALLQLLRDASENELQNRLWGSFNELLTQSIDQLNQPVERQLPDLWRRFTTLRRRIIVMRFADRFDGYLADRTVSGSMRESAAQRVRRWSTPMDALSAISAFQQSAMPREEADAQVCLLMLSLSSHIAALFTPTHPEMRVASEYYHLIDNALTFSNGNEANIRTLRRITNEHDTTGGNIAYIDRNLQAARANLQIAKTAIQNSYAATQQNIGFEAAQVSGEMAIRSIAFRSGPIFPTTDENPNPQRQWFRNQTTDANGRIQEGSGEVVRLLHVYGPFTYRPEVGSATGGGPYVPAQFINASGQTFGGVEGTAIPHVPIFEIRFGLGGEPTRVYADDPPHLLALYNDIFLWRSLQISMEDLAAFSQASMEWMMTATSMLVPGLANAEIAARVMQFMMSDEFPETIRMLKDDPLELIGLLLNRLRNELLRPENIWRFLILSGQHNPLAPLLTMVTRRRTGPLPPATTRVGRVVRSLRMLGERIHNALARVRQRVQGPVRTVQGNLARQPTLSWVLRRAVHVLEILPDLIPPEWVEGMARGDVPTTPGEIRTAIQSRIEHMEEDMLNNTQQLLEGIQHFELPGELIDLTVATELVMDLILERLGPKARIVNRLFHLIPIPQESNGRFSGFVSLHTYISNEVANAWRSTPLDPNTYWQDELRPVINTQFTELRDELVDGLYGTLNRFLPLIGARRLVQPERGALPQTGLLNTSFEAEASMNPNVIQKAWAYEGKPWRLNANHGKPLPKPIKHDFESRFGQSFAHVRLHDGQAAYSATAPIGADAVTSGSHVYVHPSVSVNSHQGKQLLAHELTHVVQQTGVQALGSKPKPSMGRSGQLRFDAGREAIAEHNAKGYARGDAHLNAHGGNAHGIAPALTERTIESIVTTLTTVRSGDDFTAQSTSTDPIQGETQAKAMWEEAWVKIGALSTSSDTDFPEFTKNPSNVRGLIKEHLRRDKSTISSAIIGIIRLAQRPRTPRVEGQPVNELAPRRFIDLLESYIFAERGISLQISLNTAQTNVDAVKVQNVAMEFIGGSSQLWDIVVARSFAGVTIPGVSDDNLQNAVRQRLRFVGLNAFIWESQEFKFKHSFVQDFVAAREAEERGTLTTVPVKSDYLDTNTTRGDSLAISTHGELTRASRRIGSFKRESHHTTQFLLAEFFSNHPEASKKAFPAHHAQRDYPDAVIFGSTGKVTAIEAPGHPRIDIASLDPNSGRGDNMPAVLIADKTHQRGELHILREGNWNERSNTIDKDNDATQGIAIENAFTRALPEEFRPRDNSPERITRFRDAVAADRPRANQAFYNAVVATYHWMYSRMIPNLKTALRSHEMAHYRSIAALNHTTNPGSANPGLQTAYDLNERDMDEIHTKAVDNNNRVMRGYGWPTPPGG